MVKEAGVNSVLVPKRKRIEMLSNQLVCLHLVDADVIRAVLHVVAYDDDRLGQQQQHQRIQPCLRGLVDDDGVEESRRCSHGLPEFVERHHPRWHRGYAVPEMVASCPSVLVCIFPRPFAELPNRSSPCDQMLFGVIIQSLKECTPGFLGNELLHRCFDGVAKAPVFLVEILRSEPIER